MEVESQQPKLKLSLITLNFTLVSCKHRRHLRSPPHPPLLPPRRLPQMAHQLYPDCRLPVILIPLSFSCFVSGQNSNPHLPAKSRTRLLTLPLLLATACLGVLIGLSDFLYTYGTSFLPVSTSSLINSTQLGFTAAFSFLIVRQRFTPYSINAVALPIVGAVILGINAKGDRPEGEGRWQYYVGFVMMVGSASCYGLVLPLVELVYSQVKGAVTYTLAMEMQFIGGFFATVFCTVELIVN